MDIQCLVYWDRAQGKVYEGSFTTVREVRAATWTGTEYVPNDAITNPNHILAFVTGVPINDIRAAQYALERWSNTSSDEVGVLPDPLEWHVKEDVATPAEVQSILQNKYVTVTWTRFKELVSDATDTEFTDDDLLTGQYP